MEVLVTGGDTDLGRMVAEGFRDAGHRVVIAGARRDDLEVAAKELDVDAIVFDNTDPASSRRGACAVPAPPGHHRQRARPALGTSATRAPTRWPTSPRHGATPWTHTRAVGGADRADLGDHLRSGGSIVNVVPEQPREGSAEAAVKAAISDWTAGQATALRHPRHHRQRGRRRPQRASPATTACRARRRRWPPRSPECRCSSPRRAARHITGQTLHVSHGALASFGRYSRASPEAKRGDRPA